MLHEIWFFSFCNFCCCFCMLFNLNLFARFDLSLLHSLASWIFVVEWNLIQFNLSLRLVSSWPLKSSKFIQLILNFFSQGIMFGYATDETEECMPLTVVLAHRLNQKIAELRRSGVFSWARPDSKTQVRKILFKKKVLNLIQILKFYLNSQRYTKISNIKLIQKFKFQLWLDKYSCELN